MIRCPRLYTLERATVNSTERKYNSIVKITCHPGYTFKAGRSFTTRCNESANWSGMPQSCESRCTTSRCKARNIYVCWEYTVYVGNKLLMLETNFYIGNILFMSGTYSFYRQRILYVGYKLFFIGNELFTSKYTIV